ncbi:MAG: type I restriction-modification enzyme R subunit C-terminal domain-containing protein, partial [Dongiaceae bacterium]
KRQRKPIYTDFEDEMGAEAGVILPGFGAGTDLGRFKAKVRTFLRDHQDHIAIHKLHMNKPLTAGDLAELERMLVASGLGAPEELERAKAEAQGLGLFIRSLVGIDREAAKQALAGFLTGKTLGANQIEFVNLIVDELTAHGIVKPEMLYGSPFTDLTPRGPEGLFSGTEVDMLLSALEEVRRAATAA